MVKTGITERNLLLAKVSKKDDYKEKYEDEDCCEKDRFHVDLVLCFIRTLRHCTEHNNK